jgi:zinc protease
VPREPGAAAPIVERLRNGLTVILRPMRQAPLVSVWCWYRVGSRDERPGLTGISHWAEHMNFKGTRSIPRDQIVRGVELAGGTWNGYTWLDVTTYFETVAREALEPMLRLEASRMTDCVYAPREVERERTVVISELQGNENDPRTFLDKEVTGTALQAHPYRWPTIGYVSDLRAITRDDLYRHYRTYYVPNNAILVVAGDLEAGPAMRLIRRLYGRLPRGPEPPPIRTVEPPQTGERRVVLRRPAGAVYLDLAWHAPAVTDAEFPVLLMTDGLLAGGPSVNPWGGQDGRGPGKTSRLYRALIEADLAVDVSTSLIPTRHPYLYRIAATARDGVAPERIEAAVEREIERLVRGDLPPRDLERARNQFLARYAMESESITDAAHQLGFFETVASHRDFLDLPRRVRRVTAEEIARFARERLERERRTTGVLLPPSAGDAPPAPAAPGPPGDGAA